MSQNKYLDLDGSDDFGFSFGEETDLTPITNEVDDLKLRLQAVRLSLIHI